MVNFPLFAGFHTCQGGAGFLPSTVLSTVIPCRVTGTLGFWKIIAASSQTSTHRQRPRVASGKGTGPEDRHSFGSEQSK